MGQEMTNNKESQKLEIKRRLRLGMDNVCKMKYFQASSYSKNLKVRIEFLVGFLRYVGLAIFTPFLT